LGAVISVGRISACAIRQCAARRHGGWRKRLSALRVLKSLQPILDQEKGLRVAAENEREDFRTRWADSDNENIQLKKALGYK